MSNEVSILLTIPAILFLSPFFAKLLRVPTVPIEIALGSIAGYYGYLVDIHLFELIAEVGFLYLMFLAGLEVDFKKVLNTPKETIKSGMYYIIGLYILSSVAVFYYNLSNIFIVALPLISIGVVATLSKEYGKNLEWIKLSMIIGTLGEIVSIILLTIVSSVLKFGIGFDFYKTLFLLIVFFAIILASFKVFRVIFWWYPELKTKLMPHIDNQEKDIRLSMAIFLFSIAVMLYLHLELAFGAFIAGIFIASFFEHKAKLPEKLESFGFGFLVPIFFIYIGVTFKMESLLVDGLVSTAFLITFLMIAIRFISSFAISTLKIKEQTLFALSHSMPLTLLIAVSTVAYHSNAIDQFHYFAFILASLLEVLFVMILIKIILGYQNIEIGIKKYIRKRKKSKIR
jgi:Kef-type K+ transport system membrane component KefB